MGIHRIPGMGLKEINYKDALEIDLLEHEIRFERERRFLVKYKNKMLRTPYVADFVIFNNIILEIKSVSSIIDMHLAQALSYLAVSEMKLALVINFGERSLAYKRIVL